jgi:aarF domain-containing kinase
MFTSANTVYKGKVVNSNGEEQDVAVKVLHPNVRAPIDADLDLLRLAASLAEHVPGHWGGDLQWLNLDGMVEEFAELLNVQLDLSNEALHLEKFNKNFRNDPTVIFPRLVEGFDATPDVLVETFEQGIPVQQFANEHADDTKMLKKMCLIGIRTICRMIFDHNFIHSDLHPGNILIQHKQGEEPKFVLLDVGMITEFNGDEYEMIVDILAAFVKSDGRRAGELMISDSNRRMMLTTDYQSANAEAFIKKIEHLTTNDKQMKFFQNIGGYIRYVCDAAATHHVKMNQAFASIALTVKVQEGVALSLDPSAKIWKTANPIILHAEARRRINKTLGRIANMLGTDYDDSNNTQSVADQLHDKWEHLLGKASR